MTKKVLTILLLIITVFGLVSAYKIQASTSIISAQNTKLKPEEKINALVDLSNVNDIEKVVITTSIYLEPVVDLSSGIDQQNIDIQNMVLTIMNITTDSIYVSYVIPKYIAEGTKIKIEAVRI